MTAGLDNRRVEDTTRVGFQRCVSGRWMEKTEVMNEKTRQAGRSTRCEE